MQTVAIRGRRETVDQFPLIRDQAHVNPLATQIQTNMQHEHSSPARRQAGSVQPTAYLDTRVVGSLYRIAGRADTSRARLTYALRYGGPTSSRRLRRLGGTPAFIAFRSRRRPAAVAHFCSGRIATSDRASILGRHMRPFRAEQDARGRRQDARPSTKAGLGLVVMWRAERGCYTAQAAVLVSTPS